jgi:hypothetical protein
MVSNMIGVALKYSDPSIVEEFFQLFKTPWEFYKTERQYDVVIAEVADFASIKARLIIILETDFTGNFKDSQKNNFSSELIKAEEMIFPVYLGAKKICEGTPFLVKEETGESIGTRVYDSGKIILKIGYNFFREAEYLLIYGQSPEFAVYPTLDIHIANLRRWIIESGCPVVEIPPVPKGYEFFVCLTHDVDFAGMRNHKFDRTLLGFIYRAGIGSIIRLFKRRLSFRNMIRNWSALLSLPLVFLGIIKDFWIQFQQYSKIEANFPSTFFLSPFKNKPGKGLTGEAPKIRSIKYDINTLINEINYLLEHGFEIGVHGIDSWADVSLGKNEYEKVGQITGRSDLGIRMHWLYFNHDSPDLIEKAGYFYDSTFGYNEAVGFRAGTLQAFRFPGTKELIELPLHIQDTALFYPGRMNLSEPAAAEMIRKLIERAIRFGGILTLNWHMRSIAPERLWGEFYMEVLEKLKNRNGKFLPAGAIVKWFKDRRSITFENVRTTDSGINVQIEGPLPENSDEMLIRCYRPSRIKEINGVLSDDPSGFVDYPLSNKSEFEFNF